MENIYAKRIEEIRKLGFDAVIIKGTDPHSSEYPADRWKQVQWVSGFTGEAGDIVVTADHAGLWTDTRYFIQANAQLKGTGIELHKTRVPGEVGIPQWLKSRFPDRRPRVAVDGLCQSIGDIRSLSFCEIIDCPDLLSQFWADRPAIPHTPVEVLSEKAVGMSRHEKISRLRSQLEAKGCKGILIGALDEIAWLLNVRGEDIDYNPYVISYLIVTAQRTVWFVRNVDEVPQIEGVVKAGYGSLADGIEDLKGCGRIMIDPSTVNFSVYKTLKAALGEDNLKFEKSPVAPYKAVKNEKEIEGFRKAFLEDGIAMENFLYWLENEVASGSKITEWDASVRLTELRSRIKGYRGNSFGNISAYGPNAALPHYSTPVENSDLIRKKGLYLVDSGGHYEYGTTDITRTVPMGRCSRSEKEDYTLVLKGMIDLSMAVFPEGTAGCQIDALARRPLWEAKKNFGHGTGHGIGFFSGVHEGPQDIRQNFNPMPLLPGMVTSNEPGLYREGKYGIRHENVLLCREHGKSEYGRFFSFETLTLCHIDRGAIIRRLLSKEERRWLNAYNRTVRKKLSPHLESEVAKWLRKKTRRI